jgi:hypothetical protein
MTVYGKIAFRNSVMLLILQSYLEYIVAGYKPLVGHTTFIDFIHIVERLEKLDFTYSHGTVVLNPIIKG